MDASALRDELVGLSDYAWQRLIDRLEGLTDAEYFWEPAPASWTIRPGTNGMWTCDFLWPPPDPPPITTIAWRLAHITVNENRFRAWLGLDPDPGRPKRTIPATAEGARQTVETTRAERQEDLMRVTDADLWEKIGVVGGPYAAGTRISWVLHTVDELIHHSAEIALLRDLYRTGYMR